MIGSDWLRSTEKLKKLDFMYGDETEIVFINSMKDSFEKCCRFTSITNLHDKYGHGNKLIFIPSSNFFLDFSYRRPRKNSIFSRKGANYMVHIVSKAHFYNPICKNLLNTSQKKSKFY